MGNAVFFHNPLDHSAYDVLEFEPGQTVEAWLDKSGMAVKMSAQPIVIGLNGEPLLEKDWGRVLAADDHIALQAAPQAEGLFAVIYWVAVSVTAAYALYTVLTLPDTPEGGFESSPNNTLSVRQNQARLGQPKPVLYGRDILYPDVSAFPFTQYEQNGDQIVYLLFELSQGSLQVDESTMKFENTPLSDFPGAQYDIIPPGSTSNLFPNDVINVGAISNIQLDQGLTAEYTVNASGTLINRISIDLVAPRGIYRQRRESGNKDRVTITYEIQTRQIDDADTPIGGWVTQGGTRTLSGATSVPIQRTVDVSLTGGRYQVRINRVDPYQPDTRIIDQLQWAGLRGFLQDALPVTTTTRIAIRIRSSNEIGNRALNKFNVVAQRLIPTWTEAGGWTAPVATSSPAWAAADVLRNTDYGAGRPDAYINLLDLEQLAIDCAAEGYETNGVFDVSGTVWDALQRIGHTCASVPVDEGGVYTLIQDKLKTTPVQMFTMRNNLRNSFFHDATGVLSETKDYVEVRFKDQLQDFRQTTIDAVLPGGTSNNPLKVDWWGVNNEAQAWRLGILIAASNRYRRERVSFEAPLEGRIPRYGDLISISHFVIGQQGAPQVSGDVLAFDAVDLITVSETLPAFTTPFVMLHAYDGTPAGPYACTRVSTNQIRIDEAFNNTGLVFPANERNPMFAIGEGSEFALTARVLSITPTDGENVRIEGFVDVPEIYGIADGGSAPAPATLENLTSYLPTITDLRAELGGAPGAIEVHLSWTGAYSDRYDIEYSADGGTNWIDMGEDLLQPRVTDRPTAAPGVIEYRVRGVSIFEGPWAEVSIDTSGTIPVAAVEPPVANELDAQALTDGVALNFSAAGSDSFGDVEVFEVWRVTAPDTLITDASAEKIADVPAIYDRVNDLFFGSRTDGTVTGGTSYSYFILTRNRNGPATDYFPSGGVAGVPVTPSSPTTGGAGPAGTPAVVADTLSVLQWQVDAAGVATPVVTQDRVISFRRMGTATAIATHTIRGVLDPVAGTISVTDQGETGEDTNITLTDGAGTNSVRIEVTHIASGVVGVVAFAVGQDGLDGTDGASLVNSLAYGWGTIDPLVPLGVNPIDSLNPSTSTIEDAGNGYIGNACVLVTGGPSGGGFYGGSAQTENFPTRIPPQRRWILLAWVSSPDGTIEVRGQLQGATTPGGTGPVFFTTSSPVGINVGATYTRIAFEIDATLEATDLVYARPRFFSNNLGDGDVFRADGLVLVDVTDFPHITAATADQYIPAYIPIAEGGPPGTDGTNGTDGTDGTDGIDGVDGASAEFNYSIDGSTNWHPVFTTGDLFARSRVGTGAWSAAFRIVGEDGTNGTNGNDGNDGSDGADGDYFDVRFRESATQPATPTGNSPAGWSDAPPVSASDPIWFVRGRKNSAGVLQGTWSTPVRLTGSGVTTISDSDTSTFAGVASVSHTSLGNAVTIRAQGSLFGFAGAIGPSSVTLQIRRGTTVLASVVYALEWSFESELSTWVWSANPSGLNQVVSDTPGAGTYSYNTTWSAGASAPLSVGFLLTVEETANV
ncbi:MAG: host specificity factor TipJ family phage tail protein [Pseudomonadaceae bacterium]|nr:host specificity factor TipJ family phage tail protein [Pseudomonadaceae bacterium]